jgi:Core-2/I-Branching enzyme
MESHGKTKEALLRASLTTNFDDLRPLLHPQQDDPRVAARQVLNRINNKLEDRLTKLFSKTKTSECREMIAQHMGYFVNAFGEEVSLPFANIEFNNTCPETVYYDWDDLPEGMHIGHVQNRSYQPPRSEAEYIDNPSDLNLLYAILTHDEPRSTIRLVEKLYEPGHLFVIHVDGKEASDSTYETLVEYARYRDYVHVIPTRVRIAWGGFSMVNATLHILKYAFATDSRGRKPLDFHKVVHMASTSYPLASNTEIRQRLADYPLDANFMFVIMKPSRPSKHSWSYFVECDDALHRIYRLEPLKGENNGMELFTSSQWWIISREFAQYLAEAKPGTFVHQYLDYIKHVVVADETFFGTVLRNTEFCTKHTNRNFLHVQFDRWESDLPSSERDERKCMMKDPNHCGRSPTTMTIDYVDILELSDDLFARKVRVWSGNVCDCTFTCSVECSSL